MGENFFNSVDAWDDSAHRIAPDFLNSANACARSLQRSKGARNTVPALALITSGSIWALPFCGNKIPSIFPAQAQNQFV